MDGLLFDVRLALRSVRRHPLFAAVAAFSLCIGIGANTAVFGVVNALLLSPVPGVAQPERVVDLGRTTDGRGHDTFAYPDYVDMREAIDAFDRIAAYSMGVSAFSLGDEGERVVHLAASADYFPVMGLVPHLGRFYAPEEDAVGAAAPVVVLSHDFWTARLAADPGVLGSTVLVNRVPMTVVGVAPADFMGHMTAVHPDLYLPIAALPLISGRNAENYRHRGASWHQAVARLSPDATLEQARTQVDALFARLAEAYPRTNARRGARVVELGLVPGAGRGPVSAFLSVLFAMSVLVLLVTCANVAGMFLARASARSRDVAVRLAVGSPRRRLVRQMLVEALVVFAIGGALGTVLGTAALQLLPLRTLPVPVPVLIDLSPDLTVLGFALGVTLLAGVGFGLMPALQTTRDVGVALREGDRAGRRATRARQIFVGAQVGLSMVLLVVGGLFVRSLQRASAVETGFEAEGAFLTGLDLSLEGYEEEEALRFHQRLLERLRDAPGVAAASISTDLPLDLSRSGTTAVPEGWEGGARGELGVDFNRVSAGYFRTLGIEVLKGREFTALDAPDSERVAVVSRAFAEAAWPDEEALGRTLRLRLGGLAEDPLVAVGVVEDVKNSFITDPREPMVYLPLTQAYAPSTSVVVRAVGGIGAVAPLLRGSLLELDPNLSLTPVVALDRHTGVGVLPQQVAAWLTGSLGALAALLSGVGIYGVVAYAVSRRTREIGVRMALGAGRRSVLTLMARGGLLLAAPGVLLGGLAALAVGRVLEGFLLGLSPADPAALAGVAVALLAVVTVASLVPARRAARVDPVRALRAD